MIKIDEIAAGVSHRTGDAGYFSLLLANTLKIPPPKGKQGSKKFLNPCSTNKRKEKLIAKNI
jgi:hypothetical protein